jgi:hypothetical protein
LRLGAGSGSSPTQRTLATLGVPTPTQREGRVWQVTRKSTGELNPVIVRLGDTGEHVTIEGRELVEAEW